MNRLAVVAAVHAAFANGDSTPPSYVCTACRTTAHGGWDSSPVPPHDRHELSVFEAALALRLLDCVRIGLLSLATLDGSHDLHALAARMEGL